ncbi:MAG: phosphate transporter ATP-binding protein [Armatimonadota bacterium]
MDIPKNAVTAFIGPSGCGKSTFLRCLNRMNDRIDGTKVTGSIEFESQNIRDKSVSVEALRRTIGMVFQKPVPFPMSIYDNIAFGPRTHGIARGRALDTLVEKCLVDAALWDEVKDKLKSSAMALSGGQQQRLCIARTLSVSPEVILMDEPCSALDPNSTHRIEELITRLKDEYTVVIVTHNLQQAKRISDNTGFFLRGELVEYADSTSVFGTPARKETDDYINGRFG